MTGFYRLRIVTIQPSICSLTKSFDISYLLRQYFVEHCALFVAFVYLTFHMHVYFPNRKQIVCFFVFLIPCLFKLCWKTITGKLHIMYIVNNLSGQSFFLADTSLLIKRLNETVFASAIKSCRFHRWPPTGFRSQRTHNA